MKEQGPVVSRKNSMHRANQTGYILAYTIIAIGVFILLATELTTSTLRELDISDRELANIKAQAAVDSGIECAVYWQKETPAELPFNTNTPSIQVRCEGSTNEPPFNTSDSTLTDPEGDCGDATYEYHMDLENGSCVDTKIVVTPIVDPDVGTPVHPVGCKVGAYASGKDDCANPTVERTRWRTF